MCKIISITDALPHKVSEVVCLNCKKRYVAVRPEDTKLIDMECPKCHKTGFIIETGEDIEE